jgi:hypothetical protein
MSRGLDLMTDAQLLELVKRGLSALEHDILAVAQELGSEHHSSALELHAGDAARLGDVVTVLLSRRRFPPPKK